MCFRFAQQIGATPRARSHFSNKFARKFSRANVAQRGSHVLSYCLIDNLWTNGQLAPFSGIRNQSAHSRESRFVNEIDNELEFVQTFEVGELGRIAGADECVEAGTNQPDGTDTQHRLLAKKISLSFLPKSRFENAGTRTANSFCPRQGRSLRVPAGILMNRNQPGRAATSQKFPAHHRSEAFGGDHHNIDIFARNDRPIVNPKAVSEDQGLTATQIWSDLLPVNGRHLRV